MNNAKAFGTVLSRIRKEQGYTGAYHFFKSAGGSKKLGLAFVSYWDMERGKKLPKSWRLKAIMDALEIEPDSPKARELVRAYFMALSGSDELIQILAAPAAAGAELPGKDLAEAAVEQTVTRRAVHLTREQWELRSRDLTTYICMNYLISTAGWVTVKELREAAGFREEDIKKALKALAGGKLAEFKGDKARTHLAQKFIQTTPMTTELAAVRARVRKYWQQWVSDSEVVDARGVTVRVTKANLELFRQHLVKSIKLAAAYHNSEENRDDSAVYYITSNIFKAYPKT